MSGPDKKKVPADMKRLAKILRAAHYRGYVVLEYEEAGNPREESAKYLEELRTAFA
jgi:sugar phosphate isomerase/epimerase